jgi:PleD family two-component response regulator
MAHFMRPPTNKIAESRPAAHERIRPMTQSQAHILVVDDERNIRNNLSMVLEAEGYKVDTASNGDDALFARQRGALRYRRGQA